MNRIILRILCLCLIGIATVSCEKDDDYTPSKPSTNTSSNTSKITKPEVSVDSRKANSVYDGWWVIAKVTTGGDDPSNVTCYLEWSKFAKKQTGSITFTNRDKMRVQASSKQRVLFKKEHAGINSGTYIYYRIVGSNSKYTVTGPTEYMVATKY